MIRPEDPSASTRPRGHAARLHSSARLQRVLDVLRGHPAGISTRDLILFTGSCAPHSDVAELRANGIRVDCEAAGKSRDGRRIFRYTLRERAA